MIHTHLSCDAHHEDDGCPEKTPPEISVTDSLPKPVGVAREAHCDHGKTEHCKIQFLSVSWTFWYKLQPSNDPVAWYSLVLIGFTKFLKYPPLYLAARPPAAARTTPIQVARPSWPCQVVKCFLLAISLFKQIAPKPPPAAMMLNRLRILKIQYQLMVSSTFLMSNSPVQLNFISTP